MASPSRSIQVRPASNGAQVVDYLQEYKRSIEACYSQDSAVEPYYSPLIDYIVDSSPRGPSPVRYISPKPTAIALRGTNDEMQAQSIQPWGNEVDESQVLEMTAPCLVTIEGFPSPDCVAYIGHKYALRPEYWLGNLNPLVHCSFFELPNLPSRRHNVVQIAIPVIGKGSMPSYYQYISAESRRGDQLKLHSYNYNIKRDRSFGSTRIRKLHSHDPQRFSVEHLVSFSVYSREQHNWVGVFLVDQGSPIPEARQTPWVRCTRRKRAPKFNPILTYNETCSPYDMPSTTQKRSTRSNPALQHDDSSIINTFHPRDHVRVRNEQDLELLRASPFAVLANVLHRAASAWTQVLNFIDSDIDRCKTPDANPSAKTLGFALEQLRFNHDFLAHAKKCCEDNIYLIECRGCPSWPGDGSYGKDSTGARLVSILLVDYRYLVNRCSDLSRRCQSVSQILMDTIRGKEALESLKLTKLAFVFIPLGVVASFFGMNVDILKNNPPIWVFVAIAVPVTVLTYLMLQGTIFVRLFKVFLNYIMIPFSNRAAERRDHIMAFLFARET